MKQFVVTVRRLDSQEPELAFPLQAESAEAIRLRCEPRNQHHRGRRHSPEVRAMMAAKKRAWWAARKAQAA